MTKKSKTAEKSKSDNHGMKLKVISCRVFAPELDVIVKSTDSGLDGIDIDWLPLRAHDQPDTLRKEIQALIDKADIAEKYDAVVLAYGLCGNATSGIRAGTLPLYIPRAHDCSQILLGGHAAHSEFFGKTPSRGWTSRGYISEEGDPFRLGEADIGWDMESLIREYGEENARYVWETLHASDSSSDPILYFLDVPETGESDLLEEARKKAEERNKELVVVPATLSLLARLLGGRGGDEILYVPPGSVIRPSWDNMVLKSELE